MLRRRTAIVALALLASLVLAPFALKRGDAAWAAGPDGSFSDISWAFGVAIFNPHQEAAGVKAKGKFYVISGSDVSCSDQGGGSVTTKVDIYDPTVDDFSSGSDVNIGRTEAPAAVKVGKSIYLIGGVSACSGTTVRTVEQLSLKTGIWTALPSTSDLPAALDGFFHCAAKVDTNIYYFQANGIGVFDTTTLTWTVLPADPLLNPSYFCRATRIGNGHVIITGPGDGSADPFSQRILDFDSASGTLTLLTSQTVAIAEHIAGKLKGHVVVAGGDFNPLNVQSIKNDTVDTLSPLPDVSDDAVGVVIKGKVYIAGGMNGVGSNLPRVLIGTPVP